MVTSKARDNKVNIKLSLEVNREPPSQLSLDGSNSVLCLDFLYSEMPLWPSGCFKGFSRGQPPGGQVKRLEYDVLRGPRVSFGEKKNRDRKLLVPTTERTDIYKHICSQRVQQKMGFKDQALKVTENNSKYTAFHSGAMIPSLVSGPSLF